MRRLILGLVLGLILAGGVTAIAADPPKLDFPWRLPWLRDDEALVLGDGQDVNAAWETTGTDYASIQTAGAVVVQEDANVDRTNAIALASGGSPILACSDDAVDLECLVLFQDGGKGVVATGAGDLHINPAGTVLRVLAPTAQFRADAGAQIELGLDVDTTSMLYLVAHTTKAQAVLAISAAAGNQFSLTTTTNREVDHGHDDEGDPMLYPHGRTSPSSEPLRWMRLGYMDDTGEQYGDVRTGEGGVNTWAPAGTRGTGTRLVHGEVNTTNATPSTCVSFSMTAGYTYTAVADVAGEEDGGGLDRGGYVVAATAYRAAVPSGLIGASTALHTAEDDGTWDADIVEAGGVISVQVTGVIATTIDWGCRLRVTGISNP